MIAAKPSTLLVALSLLLPLPLGAAAAAKDEWQMSSYEKGDKLPNSALHQLTRTTSANETFIISCASDRFNITLVFAPDQWIDAPLAPDGPVRIAFGDNPFEDLQAGYWVWGGWGTLRIVVPGAARALTERIGESKLLRIEARKTSDQWARAEIALDGAREAISAFTAACDQL